MTMSQDDPRQPGDAVEKSETEVRQATKTGYMRWVLVLSLLLGVIVLGAVYLGYTASHHQPEPAPATQAAAMLQRSGAG